MTSRRTFLKQAGVGAAALAWTRCAPETPGGGRPRGASGAPDRPNILLVTTDYQSALDVPAIGHRFLEMPTLDRLCAEGAVFRRHYSTAPICIPARNTWITGQYPHTHGKWENVGGWVPEGSPVLMQELAEFGYQSTAVGRLVPRPVVDVGDPRLDAPTQVIVPREAPLRRTSSSGYRSKNGSGTNHGMCGGYR